MFKGEEIEKKCYELNDDLGGRGLEVKASPEGDALQPTQYVVVIRQAFGAEALAQFGLPYQAAEACLGLNQNCEAWKEALGGAVAEAIEKLKT